MIADVAGDVALALAGVVVGVVIILGAAVIRQGERLARLEERTRRLINDRD